LSGTGTTLAQKKPAAPSEDAAPIDAIHLSVKVISPLPQRDTG
jgi:hypothetical protein